MAKKGKDDKPSFVGKAKFKGMSAGSDKARISIRLECNRENLLARHDLLTDAQLECELNVTPGSVKDINDQSGKQQIIKGTELRVTAIADCVGFSARSDHVDLTLKFTESAVDVSVLAKIAGKEGTVDLVRIGSSTDGE